MGRVNWGKDSSSRLAAAAVLSAAVHACALALAGGVLQPREARSRTLEVALVSVPGSRSAPAAPQPAAPLPAAPPEETVPIRMTPKPREPKPTRARPRQTVSRADRPVPNRTLPAPPPGKTKVPDPAAASLTASAGPDPDHDDNSRGLPGLAAPRRAARTLPAYYQRLLHERISRAKHYPAKSRENGEEGMVKVRFVILDSGSVSGLRVTRSSGFPLLDQAAVEAVQRAAPFPSLPEEAGEDGVSVTVPIRFELK